MHAATHFVLDDFSDGVSLAFHRPCTHNGSASMACRAHLFIGYKFPMFALNMIFNFLNLGFKELVSIWFLHSLLQGHRV